MSLLIFDTICPICFDDIHDIVAITTKDGENFEFEIVAISPVATEGFIEGYILNFPGGSGKNRDQRQIRFQIFFNEIAKIEKKKFSAGKTIVNSVVVFYGVALVSLLIASVILYIACTGRSDGFIFPDCHF